jgi:outer membrane protein assembly factor BamD
MLVRTLWIFGLIALISMSCKRENFEKIRMNPDIEFRYQKAFEYYEAGEYQKAQYLFEDLLGQIRGSGKAEKVYFYFSYTHYHLKNYNFSSYYFRQFYNTFPNSADAEEALFLSAESHYRLSPNFRLTQEDTDKAIEGYQLFVNSYPTSERVSISNEKIATLREKLEQKELDNAKGYYRRKNYQSATHSFKNMLIDFPDTKNIAYIRYMIIKSTFGYANESILSKQIERFQNVIDESQIFVRKHSDSQYAAEVNNLIEISNQRIKKLKNE